MNFDPAIHKLVAVIDRPGTADHGMQFHVGMPDLAADIEHAIAKLKAERDGTPLVPVLTPELDERVTALEQHATASGGLVDALNLVIQMAREQQTETTKLKAHARNVDQLVAVITPALEGLRVLRTA